MNRAILFLTGLVAGFALAWGIVSSKKPPSPASFKPTVVQPASATPPVPSPPPPAATPPAAAPAETAAVEGAPPADDATRSEDTRPRKASELDPRFVTFVGYNLRNYLKMERQGKGGLLPDQPKPEREIRALVEMVADVKPDILGVCEIGTREDLADLQQRLAGGGVNLPVAEWVDSADEHRNLALLSRFPIVERHHRTDLTYQLAGTVLPFGRGILDATVEPAPGYRLRLVGTHLKSKRDVEEGDQEEMRRNEAHLLRQHIDGILGADPRTNLLVYGDLNDIKNTASIQEVKGEKGSANALLDLYLRDRYGYTWTHFWSAGDQYSRFDFALVSKGLLPEIQKRDCYIHSAPEWMAASDHRPLVVRLLPEESQAARR